MSVAQIRILLAPLALALCSACTELDFEAQKGTQSAPRPTFAAAPVRKPAYWKGDSAKGAAKVVIQLSEQRAYFFKGGKVVGESNISTGRKGFETPPGRYRVIQKDENHLSNLYGSYVDEHGAVVQGNVQMGKDPRPDGTEFHGAAMPYFLRFTKGYGMHAGFVPRYRASHGCIRMPREMAKHFFDAAALNTPVVVQE
jgi:lipoprotein-anchoring transpeptidase ErfK/SrfK